MENYLSEPEIIKVDSMPLQSNILTSTNEYIQSHEELSHFQTKSNSKCSETETVSLKELHELEYKQIQEMIQKNKMERKRQQDLEAQKKAKERELKREEAEKRAREGRLGGVMIGKEIEKFSGESNSMFEQYSAALEIAATKDALDNPNIKSITRKQVCRNHINIFTDLHLKMKASPGVLPKMIKVRTYLIKLVPGLSEKYNMDLTFSMINEEHAEQIYSALCKKSR